MKKTVQEPKVTDNPLHRTVGLNESTLRKAIAYGKLVNGVDVCKFGKQWVVSIDAMTREYRASAQ